MPADPARPADPGRPQGSARPATPGGEVPGDVYVYRDTGARPDDHVAAAAGPDENDAAYWYDLPGTGSAGTGPGGDAPQVPQETRGPFEPLVSSAGPATPDAAHPGEAPGAADDGLQDTAHARARKLEQIKDLYLTAEAIGEVNVDKHFDHLLAQQRELISEYFKQSARPGLRRRRGDGRTPSRVIPGMPAPQAARRAHPTAPASPPISAAHGERQRTYAGHRGPRPR